ncbi:membrane protein [Nesterenkonia populi]
MTRAGALFRTGLEAYSSDMASRGKSAGQKRSLPKTTTRVLMGSALVGAGVGHMTFARDEFQAQVPEFVPLSKDATVLASGVAEIGLGLALVFPGRYERAVGVAAAGFFTAVFPGNLSQWWHRRDGFGLDTDRKRAVRLLFQPPLIGGVLWATRQRQGG